MARRRKTVQHAQDIRSSAALDPLRDFEGNAAEKAVARAAYYIRSNLKQFAIGAGLFVAVLATAIGVRVYQDLQEEKSVAAFEALLKNPVLDPENLAGSVAIQRIDEYMQQNGGNAEQRGLLLKLGVHAREKQYKEAADAAMRLAPDLETPELRAYLYLQAGAYFEEAAQMENAQLAYARATEDFREDNVLRAMARFGQARALQSLGKRDEAQKALQALFEMKPAATIVGEYDIRAAAVAFAISQQRAAAQP